MRYLGNLLVSGEGEGDIRIHDCHDAVAGGVRSIDHDIAGQKKSQVAFRYESTMRKSRIARAEDEVRAKLDVQLLAKRRGDVDLRQYAEALPRQFIAGRRAASSWSRFNVMLSPYACGVCIGAPGGSQWLCLASLILYFVIVF